MNVGLGNPVSNVHLDVSGDHIIQQNLKLGEIFLHSKAGERPPKGYCDDVAERSGFASYPTDP